MTHTFPGHCKLRVIPNPAQPGVLGGVEIDACYVLGTLLRISHTMTHILNSVIANQSPNRA